MERTIGRKSVRQLVIYRQQINVVHGDIIKVVLHLKKANVNQRRSVESESVHLRMKLTYCGSLEFIFEFGWILNFQWKSCLNIFSGSF